MNGGIEKKSCDGKIVTLRNAQRHPKYSFSIRPTKLDSRYPQSYHHLLRDVDLHSELSIVSTG